MDRLQEIKTRLEEILKLLTDETTTDEDVEKLEKESEDLQKEQKSLQDGATRRNATLQAITRGLGTVVEVPSVPQTATRSAEETATNYRSAYLKKLVGQELTPEERAAFTATTINTPNVLPTTMLNMIWDLVTQTHSIMDDITIHKTGTILEVVKHVSIKKGKAKKVAEGTANEDEENELVKVTLSGNDFTKHVDISYAMSAMSIDALEKYLATEIANQLGEAMSDDVIAKIKTDMNANNKTTSTTIDFKTLTNLFAKLKNAKDIKVYCNNATLYNDLVGLTDAQNRPIFQLNINEGAKGSLLGGLVRPEESLADGEILVGDSKQVIYNMVQDVIIENDKDIKKHVITYSGYARGEGALMNDKAFSLFTLTASA